MVTPLGREHSLIYIMGDGRSGSTVVSIILGNHPSISSNGELHKWPLFKGYPKGDNKKTKDHQFWAGVRDAYFAQGEQPDFSRLLDVQDQVEDYKEFPRVLLHLIPSDVCSDFCAYMNRLLTALGTVSGKSIVVDETKRPGRACVLLGCRGIDVHIIHLVRDPRGVLWSSKKKDVEHKYKSPLTAAIHYSIKNLMSLFVHLVAPRGRVLRVRYEDLARRPSAELQRIGDFLGLSMKPVADKIESGEPLQVPYLLDGNRIRHETEITLRFDDTWRRRLGFGYRLLAILFTMPFFVLFGYWNYAYDA